MPQNKPQRYTRAIITLIFSVMIAGTSGWLALGSAGFYCDRLAPLTICATLAALMIALCFRQVPHVGKAQRWVFAAALLVSVAALFADARFVLQYRSVCAELQKRIQQLNAPAAK